MFYIYILYSPGSDKYYVGYTDDVERRLTEHNDLSKKSYTSKHRPWELKAKIEVSKDRGEAMQVERFIKRQKSKRFIENLISTEDVSFIINRIHSHG